MLEIIKQDIVNCSVYYKIENIFKLNKEDKKLIKKKFSPIIAYKLARGGYFDLYSLEEYEEACLKSSAYAYLFAKDVLGANIKKCQNVCIKDPYWAYHFARDIKGANIKRCEEAADKDIFWGNLFAKNIPGANINKYKNPMLVYKSTRCNKGVNIEKCQEIHIKNSEYRDIENINTERCQSADYYRYVRCTYLFD